MVEVEGPVPGLSVELLTHGPLTWAYVERPSPAELDFLRERFDLHPAHLAECLGHPQRPRSREQPGYLFLAFAVPLHNRGARAVAVGDAVVFLARDALITVHRGDVQPLARLFRECQGDAERRAELMGRGAPYLLYTLADRLVGHCLQVAEALAQATRTLEDGVLTGDVPDPTREVAAARRETAVARRTVEPQRAALAELARLAEGGSPLGADLAVYWRSLADQLDRAAATLEACAESIGELAAAEAALDARRTRQATTLAAVVAATALPALGLAALFAVSPGAPPLAGYPQTLVELAAAMGLVVALALYLFRRARWL